MAQVVAPSQALLLLSFNAIIPTFAAELFGFGSPKASLLFVPLGLLNVIMGPLGDRAFDDYGTKFVAIAGFGVLATAPALARLRLPVAEPFTEQMALYTILLAFCWVRLPLLGPSSFVEAGLVIKTSHRFNPGRFGEQGPYAQLYSVNHTVFSFGLGVGPELAGELKQRIGYGNMTGVLASISALTAGCCFVWLGNSRKGPQ
jgi:predicted MFS family arabinose efflux permease